VKNAILSVAVEKICAQNAFIFSLVVMVGIANQIYLVDFAATQF
jgi:hypothetical protein